MGIGGGKKASIAPPAPSPPPPTPSAAGESAVEVADKEKKKLKNAYAGRKTILTGAGLGLPETDKKNALG